VNVLEGRDLPWAILPSGDNSESGPEVSSRVGTKIKLKESSHARKRGAILLKMQVFQSAKITNSQDTAKFSNLGTGCSDLSPNPFNLLKSQDAINT
jgi:hypothetical protein